MEASNIEKDIFKKSKVNIEALLIYGFIKEKDNYVFTKTIMDNKFLVKIFISKLGEVHGKIYDLSFDNEEYTAYKRINAGSFASLVKLEYENILKDIKKLCFTTDYFLFSQTNRIIKRIIEIYHDEPQFLWEDTPDACVFKNKDTNKWYALVISTDKSKLTDDTGKTEVINIKLDSQEVEILLTKKGYYKAYHMNKKYWISIIFDDTVNDDEIIKLVEKSYAFTLKKGKKYENDK